jgi:transposase
MEPEKPQGALGTNQGWSARRKGDAELWWLRGEALDIVSRELGVEVYRLEAWRVQVLTGMESALKQRDSVPLAEKLKAAKRHIGELTMEVEILGKERDVVIRRPLAGRKSRK